MPYERSPTPYRGVACGTASSSLAGKPAAHFAADSAPPNRTRLDRRTRIAAIHATPDAQPIIRPMGKKLKGAACLCIWLAFNKTCRRLYQAQADCQTVHVTPLSSALDALSAAIYEQGAGFDPETTQPLFRLFASDHFTLALMTALRQGIVARPQYPMGRMGVWAPLVSVLSAH